MATKDEHFSDIQKQELEDSTNCCICAEIYKCPKLLPCGHTFCMNCIQETGLKTSKGPGDEMPCPICRRHFRIPSVGLAGLQHNYYVEGLIRIAQILNPSFAESIACDACLEENQKETVESVQKADMYCTDCKQKLCEECCRHHRKLKLTKNHKLISINEQRPTDEDLIQSLVPIVCELHKQEDLKIYCCICKTVVCAICFTEYHECHKGTHVTKAADEFRKEIANNVEKVKTFVGQAEMKKSEIINTKQDVHEKFGSLECDIISRRDGLRQLIDKHANSLLEELCSLKLSILKELHIETDDIDVQLTRLESYNSYCKKIMTKGSACDICRSVGDLSAKLNELQEETQPLIEQKLKPVTLFFVETDFEEEDGGSMIGQLKEQGYPKQITKTKEHIIEEIKKENEILKSKIENKRTENEILTLANEKLKLKLNKEEQTNNVRKLMQALDNEKLIDKALQNQIDNLAEQGKPAKMTTTPYQVDEDKFITVGTPSKMLLRNTDLAKHELETTKAADQRENLTTVGLKEKKEIRGKEINKNKKEDKSNRRFLWNTLTYSTKLVLISTSNSMTTVVKEDQMTAAYDMDVLVTCIDHRLDIDGTQAAQIIKAAGPSVMTELVCHKKRLLALQTGDLVHTSAGNLKGVKAIIHVVRPQDFFLNEQMSTDALRNVFTNCLRYANDELELKSICLPPIGFGLYTAQMVVDSFMDAVEMFTSTIIDIPSTTTQHQRDHINYIQLVSNDPHCIGKLIQCIKKRLGEQ